MLDLLRGEALAIDRLSSLGIKVGSMKTLLCHLKYILFSRYKKYVIQTESLAQPFDMLLCHLKYILFSSYKEYVIQIESPAQPFDMKIWGSIARDGLRFFSLSYSPDKTIDIFSS